MTPTPNPDPLMVSWAPGAALDGDTTSCVPAVGAVGWAGLGVAVGTGGVLVGCPGLVVPCGLTAGPWKPEMV